MLFSDIIILIENNNKTNNSLANYSHSSLVARRTQDRTTQHNTQNQTTIHNQIVSREKSRNKNLQVVY